MYVIVFKTVNLPPLHLYFIIWRPGDLVATCFLYRQYFVYVYTYSYRYSQKLLDDCLSLRLSAAELFVLTRLSKIKNIYQCTLDSAYESSAASRSISACWRSRNKALSLDETLSDPLKHVVDLMRCVFVPGLFYTVPKQLLEDFVPGSIIGDPVELTLVHD